MKIGNNTLELELNPPSPELQEVAKKELRESPEVQKEAIARLKELLKGFFIYTDIKKLNKIMYKILHIYRMSETTRTPLFFQKLNIF